MCIAISETPFSDKESYVSMCLKIISIGEICGKK
jgi:hypothetical protein